MPLPERVCSHRYLYTPEDHFVTEGIEKSLHRIGAGGKTKTSLLAKGIEIVGHLHVPHYTRVKPGDRYIMPDIRGTEVWEVEIIKAEVNGYRRRIIQGEHNITGYAIHGVCTRKITGLPKLKFCIHNHFRNNDLDIHSVKTTGEKR